MTKHFLLLLALTTWHMPAYSADLLTVFNQAQISDPRFQQAMAQRLATKEGIPISLAALLPTMSLSAKPTTVFTSRGYAFNLSLNQTVFNIAQVAHVASALATSKQAEALLNAASQDLIVRVSHAYFAILRAEDNVYYAKTVTLTYAAVLDQTKELRKSGLKTMADVYAAQAAHAEAVATHIEAQTILANANENLHVITGATYPHLSALRSDLPLTRPTPRHIDQWVATALQQNWRIKAAQYALASARQTMRQQSASHLPTINLEASLSRQPANAIDQTLAAPADSRLATEKIIGLNVSLPLFAGGSAVAQTNQANYHYQISQQRLEQTVRHTMMLTRQSYLSIITAINQVTADRQLLQALMFALKGVELGYQLGTKTIIDVLKQRQQMAHAKMQYAADSYAFLNYLFALKQAAGTLSFADLSTVNAWLIPSSSTSHTS